ncbi:phospholipase D family protein [Clostridium sp. FP1]|uniref:phospholipase D family protein n=1 Tax=Clostridium sp. FP1 TaxID=2724076 RepID=UPI0013E927AE|nr:phospholipase D family protein [Clostridium sp. FP1]MBZ9633321.1 phospholipase D family protein [Clostridium sp. FP1]
MNILNQPYEGALGDILINYLQSENNSFDMVSAYAKLSGVLRLKPSLLTFKSNGGSIRAFIGIDQRNTSFEALVELYNICDELYVVHSENFSHTFHHKIYTFYSEYNAWVAIGSNNMTGGGLWTNYETSMIFNYDLTNYYNNLEFNKVITLLNCYSQENYPCSIKISNLDIIDLLLKEEYILKEATINAGIGSSRRTTSNGVHTKLFGSELFKAPPLPSSPIQQSNPLQNNIISENSPIYLSPNSVQTTAPTSSIFNPVPPTFESCESFWFEMRASTGGSKNILDLSMSGRIMGGTATGTRYEMTQQNHMHGGVLFFDVNPTSNSKGKNITINFEGIDYYPSTILFADNNGSFRLQLKGPNPENTHALSEFGRTRFKNNILVFKKVSTDYYILSVVGGTQISTLRANSQVYACNGNSKTSKQYGLLSKDF